MNGEVGVRGVGGAMMPVASRRDPRPRTKPNIDLKSDVRATAGGGASGWTAEGDSKFQNGI